MTSGVYVALMDPKRLRALRETALMDSPAEASFDRFTRLASLTLNTPTSIVSVIDADRHFLKSCVGVPEPWAGRRELPMSHSFCKFVVAEKRPLIVDDARLVPHLKDTPGLLDMNVVAYVGMPLFTPEQYPLGTLCVADRQPRKWTARDITILQDLSAALMAEIELRMLKRLAGPK
jgi:GAF domain-containing protein